MEIKTLSDKFEALKSFGFKVPENAVLKSNQVASFMKKASDYKEEPDHDIDIDGIVVAVNSLEIQEKMGWEDKRLVPKFSMALKEFSENALPHVQTVVTGLTWSIKGQHHLNPVINLQPVEDPSDGAEIKGCICKSEWIRQGLIRVGTVVTVVRGSLIIPRVVGFLRVPQDQPVLTYPTHCPCCGALLVREGDYVRCMNPDCSEKIISQFDKFFKRSYKYQVKNFGRGLAKILVDSGVRLVDFFQPNWQEVVEGKLPAKFVASKTWIRFRENCKERMNPSCR